MVRMARAAEPMFPECEVRTRTKRRRSLSSEREDRKVYNGNDLGEPQGSVKLPDRRGPTALTCSFTKSIPMPRPAVNVAARAARSAGNIILRYMNRLEGLAVVEKQRMDFASEVDRLAEAEIVKELRRAYPTHAILGEESGQIGKGPLTWVIDPLDGTHNYLRGIPHFCVSIALVEKGEPVYGVVFDPLRDELFTASKGDGAYLNDRRIRVGKREGLSGALIATGYPYRARNHLEPQLAMTAALLAEAEDIRRMGSAALDLAYVASGRVDGFFEPALNIWDIAAGALLVREAGGVYNDFGGREGLPESGNIIAGNHKVAAAMTDVIKTHATARLLGV
jgi:myo-inositol-1(or 4)-monophosphatase